MTVISIVSQKGGSGKSTIAVNLAVAAMRDGLKVSLIDLDPQGTASSWIAVRGLDDIELVVCNGATLARTIERQNRNGFLILIDTPPHNSALSAGAIHHSDLCIAPTRASAFDLAAVSATAALIQSARCKTAFSIINAALPTSDIADTTEFLTNAGLPVLSVLSQRVAYQHAAAAGRGVLDSDQPPSARQARNEFLTLWTTLTTKF